MRGEREITVQIPAGRRDRAVHDAARRRERRARAAARAATCTSLFEVADDPRFERDGEDLYTEVLVTYPQLVLGAERERADRVRSHRRSTCPPARRAARSFICADADLPRVNASGTGDLHVRVQLWTPERLTDEERQLIARLGELQPGVPADGRGKGFWAKMKEALGA